MASTNDAGKRAAGYAAVDRFVGAGTCIGLGTGTTAFYAIERVGARVAAGERIEAVVTSSETEALCRRWNVPVVGLLEREMTVAIDGADEVAPDWALTKGGGGALFREKAVALCALRFVVIVTESKLVSALGAFPLPVEIVPYALPYVVREILRANPQVGVVRRGGDTPTTGTGFSIVTSRESNGPPNSTRRCVRFTASSRPESSRTSRATCWSETTTAAYAASSAARSRGC
jgi:ribose 5-phosphate isomerase A